MLVKPTYNSETMGVSFDSGFKVGIKVESGRHSLNNWVYHGWEGLTEVFIIKVHLSLTILAGTLLIRANVGRHMPLGFSNFFEMHSPAKHGNLVAWNLMAQLGCKQIHIH